MGQMSTSQARVVNSVLTTAARGYTNPDLIGSKLFPFVPVAQRGGKIIEFGKEQFRLKNTARAPGTKVATTESQFSNKDYALTNHALTGKIPEELLQEAQNGPGVDMGKLEVFNVLESMRLQLEYKQAQLARDANNYANSNKTTLSGSSQWSHDDSDPKGDISGAREVIRSLIGRYPNTLVLGPKVATRLKDHPKLVERFKYVSADSLSLAMLANLFEVDQVVTGEAVYEDADGVMQDVWGDDAILAYTTPASLAAMGAPTYGYTYQLRNYPIVESPHFDKSCRSWMYPVVDEYAPYIVGADAGYVWKDCLA